MAGTALQAYIGNFRSENESRSALRRHYLVKIFNKDLDYWAECEKRAVSQHRKMANMSRGRAITRYLSIAQEQPTYGVQYHRGITDKSERQWVIGVCYRGLHRYQPGHLEQPEKIFDWKKLENLYYRDRKFSVEVSTDHGHGGVKAYSWYGPQKIIKALWNSAIHAHQFYLDRRNAAKTAAQFGQSQSSSARIQELDSLPNQFLLNIFTKKCLVGSSLTQLPRLSSTVICQLMGHFLGKNFSKNVS